MTRTYTYIVECTTPAVRPTNREAYNGDVMHTTYYVGSTNNIKRRITEHLTGKGAKYLRGRTILRVCYIDGRSRFGHTMPHQWSEAFTKTMSHHNREQIMRHAFGDSKCLDQEHCKIHFPNWRPAWRRCTCNKGWLLNVDLDGDGTNWKHCEKCSGTGGQWLLSEEKEQ